MAIQTVTSPIALDETLQATNSVLEDIRDAIGASSLIGDTDISEIADGTLTGAVAEFDTKLSGISDGANKVEASQTNGNIKIDGTETQVYDDSEIKTELSTATSEVEGNPISFNTLTAQNATECAIDLEPIQDLHGYDKPWVGGAGKNLLPMTLSDIESLNTSGSWSGNQYTNVDTVFTILTDSDDNVIGIKCDGNSGNQRDLKIASATFKAGSYILTSGRTVSTGYVKLGGASAYGTEISIDFASDTSASAYVYVTLTSSTTSATFYPMFRLSTVTDSTFAPYTNECPISGRTEIGILGCGQNVFDEVMQLGDISGATGEEQSSNVYLRSNYLFVNPLNTYYLCTPTTIRKWVYCYDKDKQYLGLNTYIDGDTNTTFTLPQNAYYIRFLLKASAYGSSTYQNNVCLNVSDTNFNGQYVAYNRKNDLTISLGQTVYGGTLDVKRGVLRVDKVHVNLGDLAWGKAGTNFFASSINDFKYIQDGDYKYATYFISSDYNARYNTSVISADGDIILFYNEGYSTTSKYRLFIRDDSKASLTSTEFKSAVDGVDFVYELATPTEIQLTPHQISLLEGVNNISTTGDKITLTYRDGKVATLGDLKKAVDDMSAKQHIYSTEEQVVGTWIDGKPVYEITVTFALKSIVGNSWSDVDTFLNIDTLIEGWGRHDDSDVTNVFLGIFRYDKSNNKLKMWFPTSYSITGYIIRYTKTTDT